MVWPTTRGTERNYSRCVDPDILEFNSVSQCHCYTRATVCLAQEVLTLALRLKAFEEKLAPTPCTLQGGPVAFSQSAHHENTLWPKHILWIDAIVPSAAGDVQLALSHHDIEAGVACWDVAFISEKQTEMGHNDDVVRCILEEIR